MKKLSWKSLAKQFNQLKFNERRLIILTSAVLILALFTLLLWESMINSWIEQTRKLDSLTEQIDSVNQSIEQIIIVSNKNPNATLRTEIESLTQKIQSQQSKIASITSALVTPERMSSVFDELLAESKLILNSMENDAANGVKIPGQTTETALLYEHSLRLEMEGSYVSVLNYVRRLEKQNWKLYWDELIYKTTDYPSGDLKLKVHTLSTSEHVLGF